MLYFFLFFFFWGGVTKYLIFLNIQYILITVSVIDVIAILSNNFDLKS